MRRGKKSVALLPPQPTLPVVTAAKPGTEPVPTQHPPEVVARANATCGKGSIDAEHVKTVRLAAGQLLHFFFCGQHSGAAGMNHAFLLMPDGKPETAVKPRFVLPPHVARHITVGDLKIPKNKDAVFNPEFDASTLTLTSILDLARGRRLRRDPQMGLDRARIPGGRIQRDAGMRRPAAERLAGALQRAGEVRIRQAASITRAAISSGVASIGTVMACSSAPAPPARRTGSAAVRAA